MARTKAKLLKEIEKKKKPKNKLSWVQALKEWNKNSGSGSWCVPRKGTAGHTAVRHLMTHGSTAPEAAPAAAPPVKKQKKKIAPTKPTDQRNNLLKKKKDDIEGEPEPKDSRAIVSNAPEKFGPEDAQWTHSKLERGKNLKKRLDDIVKQSAAIDARANRAKKILRKMARNPGKKLSTEERKILNKVYDQSEHIYLLPKR